MRGSRHAVPPLSSSLFSTSPHAHPAPESSRTSTLVRSHLHYGLSSLAALVRAVDVLAPSYALQTAARPFSSADFSLKHDAAAGPPIRSTRELHTTLLSIAHASTSPSLLQVAGGQHVDGASTGIKAGQTGLTDVAPFAVGEADAASNFPQRTLGVPATGTERRLLQKLLLHRRRGREEKRESRFYPAPSPPASLASTKASTQARAAATSHVSVQASWTRAFELFSEAVQQHHVAPTAQHFNLLLYIAQQHRLWSRVDAVEEFQAHLLASVQQLAAEKKREEGERRRAERTRGGAAAEPFQPMTPPVPASTLPNTSLFPSSTASPAANQIQELREMEEALMPNAQTYELLLAAALARGLWGRALEYCEMRTRSGAAVLTDTSVRQVLHVYALAGAVASSEPAVQPAQQPHLSPPHRLRTDQQGAVLRAAAQTRSPLPSLRANPHVASSVSSPSPLPYWSTALEFFRSSLHRVTGMQTVWSMVKLLRRAGQQREVLMVVNEECARLVQSSLSSLAAHALHDPWERLALLRTLQAASDAACELGDWRVAQQLLRDVVELRRQLAYAQSTSVGKAWGAHSRLLASAEATEHLFSSDISSLTSGLQSDGTSTTLRAVDLVSGDSDTDDTWVQSELQLSRHILQNTLHTLRRVRRYSDMVELYRTSPHHTRSSVSVVFEGTKTETGELARVWQAMWAPAAISFVAQAGLATSNLDLLLELCGLTAASTEQGTDVNVRNLTLDAPADVYDATLRLLQSHILQQHVSSQAASPEDKNQVAEDGRQNRSGSRVRHYVALSQRVYAVYRHRAVQAVEDERSPYREYLKRLTREENTAPHADKSPQLTKEEGLIDQSPSVLSATHTPLVQLLSQTHSRDATGPAPRSLQQQALEQFKRIRQPDTLAIALVMDIVRSQTSGEEPAITAVGRQRVARPVTDAVAQSSLVAIEEVLNAVLSVEQLGVIQLSSSSFPSAQQESALRNVSPRQLTALSTVTSSAVLMSFDALARVQPLALLRLIPLSTQLGWLPREMAPEWLQTAQRAVVAWSATQQQQQQQQQQQESASLPPSRIAPQAQTRTTASPTSTTITKPHSAMASGTVVASFVELYAHFAVVSNVAKETPGDGAASEEARVVAAAAQLLAELQRVALGHPPTAAMAAFKRALHDVGQGRAVLPPDPEALSLPAQRGVAAAVTASINAVVQQVGASTVSRWTMWGDCADLLGGYLTSPLSSPALHNGQDADTRSQAARGAAPNVETVRVLHAFIRLCDKAEAPFVEYVAMRWVLGGEEGAGAVAATTAADACKIETLSHSPNADAEKAALAVQKLCELCARAPQPHQETNPTRPPSATARSAMPVPLSGVQMESMLLLLDALAWACRRRDRSLARRLYTTLSSWIDVLFSVSLPSSQEYRDGSVGRGNTSLSSDLFSQQLDRLRGAAQTSCMAVLQCFSSGARHDVLRDWPVQLHVLRLFTACEPQHLKKSFRGGLAAMPSPGSPAAQRRTAVLVDALAAVVVKLQRTFHFLLIELALDTHRAFAEHSKGTRRTGINVTRKPVAPHHRAAVEAAADALSELCVSELLACLILPGLRACAPREKGGAELPTWRADAQQAAATVALLSASQHKVITAVWELDFVAFAWHTRFCPLDEEDTAEEPERAFCVASRLRQRGFQLLSSQLHWPDTGDTVARHVRLWLLFSAHLGMPAPTGSAKVIAELCRDLTALEALYGTREMLPGLSALSSAATPDVAANRATTSASSSTSLLHLFVQQVDELATAVHARARSAPSSSTAQTGSNVPHLNSAELPRMSDGSSAMDLLTKPLLHFTYPVLRVLQQAAQQVLCLLLCEGTTDVWAGCSGYDSTSLASRDASSSSALPPALLRRCLAWPGQSTTYPILLRAVEAAAHETLREPEAVADVFRNIATLHSGDSSTRLSSAEMFLSFYLNSATLRRSSQVNEQVCLAALLACAAAASTRTCARGALCDPPPSSLITLLRAFPQVLSSGLFLQWQQRALTGLQERVLRSWMLSLFWGGTHAPVVAESATATPAALAVTVEKAVQQYRSQSPSPFPLPLRRAAMEWLVLTQGTVLPSRPPSAAAFVFSSAVETETPLAATASNEEMIQPSRDLVALLDVTSESFANLVNGSAMTTEGLQMANTRLRSLLSRPPRHGSPDDVPVVQGRRAAAAIVRAAISQCATRDAVQRLLLRYATADAPALSSGALKPPRHPVRPRAVELVALVEVLPVDKQDAAKTRFVSGAESSDEKDNVSASNLLTLGKKEQPTEVAWTSSLQHCIEALTEHAGSKAGLAAFLRAPPLGAFPSQDSAEPTWKSLYAALTVGTREKLLHPRRRKQNSGVRVACEAPGMATLQFAIEHCIREGAALRSSGQTFAAEEASACVNVLLVLSCLYVPLSSSTLDFSPPHAVAMLRYELLQLLCALSPSTSSSNSSEAPPPFTAYKWLIEQHVRPLMLTFTAPPPPSESTEVVEAFATAALVVHHISTTACAMCFGPTSPVHAFDSVYEAADVLFQQSCQDICELFNVCASAQGSVSPLLCRSLRAWMQAGVLLNDARSLLWVGQRLTASRLRRQQEDDAAEWAGETRQQAASSPCTVKSGGDDAWLSVLPVAAAVCAALRRPGASSVMETTLAGLFSAIPLLQRADATATPTKAYGAVIRLWQEQMRQRASAPSPAASTAQQRRNPGVEMPSPLRVQHQSYIARLVRSQPFSVILWLPLPVNKGAAGPEGNATDELLEGLRRRVTAYLSGPPSVYACPRLDLQQAGLSGHRSHEYAALSGSCASKASLTADKPLNLVAAMQCLKEATTADMRVFVQLESTKRDRKQRQRQKESTQEYLKQLKRGRAVQAAWRTLESAALHHRQLAGNYDDKLESPLASTTIPLSDWATLFLGPNVAAVPHTIHFVRPEVSEMVILESCADWSEALAVLQHSLSTLQRTGATPVQQYMAQLLLQRLRISASSSPLTSTDSEDAFRPHKFDAGLSDFSYTVSAATSPSSSCGLAGVDKTWRLWHQQLSGYEARRTAALVCRVIDVLLDSYQGHSASASPALAQHTLMEALRCSVHDAAVTRALFLLFWVQCYQRVEGAHAFLSALRAAKLACCEALAVHAILTYLWVTTPGSAPQRAGLWQTHVCGSLSKKKDTPPAVDLAGAAAEAQETTGSWHQLSVEAHRAVWKSWSGLCRVGIISESTAFAVVDVFKALDRLTEVEELMVTTCYALKK